MKTCNMCGRPLEEEGEFLIGNDALCEDCYIDKMARPRVCDPWAVYTAKRTSYGTNPVLLPLQQKILDYIRQNGPVDLERILRDLKISEDEFRTNFAVLRHLELLRATKGGDKILYTLFN